MKTSMKSLASFVVMFGVSMLGATGSAEAAGHGSGGHSNGGSHKGQMSHTSKPSEKHSWDRYGYGRYRNFGYDYRRYRGYPWNYSFGDCYSCYEPSYYSPCYECQPVYSVPQPVCYVPQPVCYEPVYNPPCCEYCGGYSYPDCGGEYYRPWDRGYEHKDGKYSNDGGRKLHPLGASSKSTMGKVAGTSHGSKGSHGRG